ncbi:hypothetical protein F-VV10_0192 [Faustovirus]|nr:hypothetical protein F-VV10_0192 [Faustovirus]
MSSVEYKEKGTIVLEHEGRKLEPAVPYTYMDDGTKVYAFAEAWNAVNVRLTTKEKRRNAPPNPEKHDPTLIKDVHYYTIIFRLQSERRGGLARNVVTKEVIDDLQAGFYDVTARRLKRMDEREAERKRKREERENNTNQSTIVRRSRRLQGESAELSSSESSAESGDDMSDIESDQIDITMPLSNNNRRRVIIDDDETNDEIRSILARYCIDNHSDDESSDRSEDDEDVEKDKYGYAIDSAYSESDDDI